MAKPRVFISSTYFDLKYIRKNLELFVEQMGYEPVLFESGDIPFQNDLPLDLSCYKEIANCHIQILIVGGRYGAPSSLEGDFDASKVDDEHFQYYNSITKTEYLTARDKGIPVFIFVQKGVLSEYETYKKNRENKKIVYAHVDNVCIFRLIDGIYAEKAGNFIKDFENFDEIQLWLKDQWAGIFADFLSRPANNKQLNDLSDQVQALSVVVKSLQEYSEAIIKKMKPDNYELLIKEEREKQTRASLEALRSNAAINLMVTQLGGFSIDFLSEVIQNCNTFEDLVASLSLINDQPVLYQSSFFRTWMNDARFKMGKAPYDYHPVTPYGSFSYSINNETGKVTHIR